jgi:CPA1 family monovalent cation:H+ antiporter
LLQLLSYKSVRSHEFPANHFPSHCARGAFGALNYLFLKLPSAIGILVVSLLASLVILLVDLVAPALGIADVVRDTVTGIDFSEALLEGMLGLLLFAGALHVKLSDLKKEWRLVFLMATIGIALSTAVVGFGF